MIFSKTQQKAIEFKDGVCMCLAGPGSGKTTVLTGRVHNLIKEHKVRPENILVITFTKAAAAEMKTKDSNYIMHTYGRFDIGLDHGKGATLWDVDGNKYIDMNIIIDDNMIALDIIDEGVGIEDVEQAKEPLFSTKAEDERSGLGFTIMEMFTDLLVVNSTLNKGTEVYFEKKW